MNIQGLIKQLEDMILIYGERIILTITDGESEYAVCSECGGSSGMQFDGVEPIPLKTNFCPNCGADVRGENK